MQVAERSHERAQQRPLLAEQEAKVELHVPAGGVAAGHQTPARRQRLQALAPGGGAHVLEHDIHTALTSQLLHFRGNVLRVMIDYVVRARSEEHTSELQSPMYL